MTDDLEARIVELRKRRQVEKGGAGADLDQNLTMLSAHAEMLKAGLEAEAQELLPHVISLGRDAARAMEEAEKLRRECKGIVAEVRIDAGLARSRAKGAWFALAGAILAAGLILLLAVWAGASIRQAAVREAETIRLANVRELTRVRSEGERALSELHEQLGEQRQEIERHIEAVGAELAGLNLERDAVYAELQGFISLRDALGIQLVETRTRPVIVVPEGQEIRLWRAPGLSPLAGYNGRMYRVMARE